MRPRHQIGERKTPTREGHRHAVDGKLALQHFPLLLRRDGLRGGDETGRKKRVVGEITVDQKPPAGSLRKNIAPIRQPPQ